MKTKNDKKNTIFFILSLMLSIMLFTLSSCSGIKAIPEISPTLYDEDVLVLSQKPLAKKIIKNKSDFVFFTVNGEIFRWNPGEKMVNFLYKLKTGIEPEIFNQGNYAVLKQQHSGTYVIFDLDGMKEIAALGNLKIKKIVAVDQKRVVYLSDTGELIFFDYLAKAPLKTLKPDEKTVFNSEIISDKILILSRNNLYIYNKGSNTVKTLTLKYKAGSGFLADGRWIYYGSDKRELIKFSATSGKTRWRFEMGGLLKIKPVLAGPYIVVIPEDNNIYFFNKKGTLHWWEKLDSSRLRPPMPMEKNVVVFLWNQKVKFFNYKKKQVITYPLNLVAKSNPLNIDEYIYIVTEDDVEEKRGAEGAAVYKRLSKIGNHYGVKITTDPQDIKPKGKSVEFNLKSFNLIKPRFRIKIFHIQAAAQPGNAERETVVFERQISKKDKPSFVWIPANAAKYRLVLEAYAENRNVIIEETFEAVEIDEKLQEFYYEVQSQCDAGVLDQEIKN